MTRPPTRWPSGRPRATPSDTSEALRRYDQRPPGWGPAVDAWHDQWHAWLDDHPEVDWVEVLRLHKAEVEAGRMLCKCGWSLCRSCREHGFVTHD